MQGFPCESKCGMFQEQQGGSRPGTEQVKVTEEEVKSETNWKRGVGTENDPLGQCKNLAFFAREFGSHWKVFEKSETF